MKRLRHHMTALILALGHSLYGQGEGFLFSGHFTNTPFAEFTETINQQYDVTFFFREAWVKDLRVTLSGDNLSLVSTLDSILRPAGMHCFLDEWGHLFLSDTLRLISRLPDYLQNITSEPSELSEPGAENITRAEQKYIDGRRSRAREIIHVGSGEAAAQGEKVLVSGKLSDSETGEPLLGATLYIEALRRGVSTNANGLFSLVLFPGTYEAECNSMGMEPLHLTLVVHSQGAFSRSMERALFPLDEVVVRANRYPNVGGNQMGFERLNYRVLKEIPLVMGERDILNVARLLPGVQSVGEGSAGFNVRGSSADQNMIYINRIPVYNSAHLFGFFTAFSPEIVSDFTLYKSNLPASLGGRLASFFDIQTRQGNMKRFSARGGISSVSAYAALESPIRKDRSSVMLSARSTYSDWILKRLEDPRLRDSKAGFNDFSASYSLIPGERTFLKIFGYLSRDRFRLGKFHTYAYGNTGASVNLHHRFTPRTDGDLAFIFSSYQFSNSDIQDPSSGYEHAYRIDHTELRADFNWLSLERHKLGFGADVIYYHLNRGVIEPYGTGSIRSSLDLGVDNGTEMAAYLADEITFSDRLTAYAGLRLSGFMSLGPSTIRTYTPGMPLLEENITDTLHTGRGAVSRSYMGVEPRLNLRYLIGPNSSVKFSYNRGSQYLFMLTNTVAMAPSDQWKLCDYHLGPQYLDQISAGYYQDLPAAGLSTSFELYRKWGHQIVEYRDGASFTESPYIESETLQGEQKAYGVEAMIRRNTGTLSGWLTYSYTRSFMQVSDPVKGEQINGGRPYPSNFDRPHSVAFVANIKAGRRLSFSTNLIYVTGRPVTFPVSVYYEYEIPYIHYSDRNRYRLPDYFRIDFSMNMEGNLKKKKVFHSYWMLGVYNLTGRRNAYSVFFRSAETHVKGYKLSIFGQPIYTLSWNIKLGNYATE